MKRTRAQQPKGQEQQDPTAANPGPKPQRRPKQPRQSKGGGKKGAAAAAAAAAREAAEAAAVVAVAASSPAVVEVAPVVPDVCVGAGGRGNDAAAAHAVEWDLDADVDGGGGAWWTWGVEAEKLLGWFPFVEEDFRCRGGDAELAFDDDIWRIHQIYEIPNSAAK